MNSKGIFLKKKKKPVSCMRKICYFETLNNTSYMEKLDKLIVKEHN